MSRSVSAPSSVTNTSPCWKGFMVPGSPLVYGSSFCMVTRRPRAVSNCPRLEAVSPLPSDDATPPVPKMCLVADRDAARFSDQECPVSRPRNGGLLWWLRSAPRGFRLSPSARRGENRHRRARIRAHAVVALPPVQLLGQGEPGGEPARLRAEVVHRGDLVPAR